MRNVSLSQQQEGQHLIVCDAGGGTIDISSYRVESTSPSLSLVETSPSECKWFTTHAASDKLSLVRGLSSLPQASWLVQRQSIDELEY